MDVYKRTDRIYVFRQLNRLLSAWPSMYPETPQVCATLSAAHDSCVFLSGVSVHPETSSVRKRGVVLLLLPGQPRSCYHHRDRGHLPFSRHQQGAFGFSRTRWVFSFGGFFPADLMLLAFIRSFACFNFVIGGFSCTLEDLHDQTRHAIYSSIIMSVNGLEKNG